MTFDRFFAKVVLKEEYTEEKALCLERLMQSVREGHLCVKKQEIGELPASIIEEGENLFPTAPIVQSGEYYYLQKNWVYETYILQHIARLRNQAPPSYFSRHILEELSQSEQFLPAQRAAIQT